MEDPRSKYRLLGLLAWGAQGDVHRAVDPSGREVAVKIVDEHRFSEDPTTLERLRREGRLLATVRSPHIVAMHEYLQGAGWAWLVLELLIGQRLDAAVRARAGQAPEPVGSPSGATVALAPETPRRRAGAAPAVAAPPPLCTAEHVAWALDVARQLARGVVAMRAVGLLHRDIKPQNVMLVDGRAVLIDFGFARSDEVTRMTATGQPVGTFAYMAPEAVAGGVTERSDVYSLGATVHECLTGVPPFGRDRHAIELLVGGARARDVRAANRAVDASLAAVIARCLEPDPRDRYASAADVLADLDRVHAGERVRAPFSLGRVWRHRRRQRRVAAVLAAALALALTGGWLLADPRSGTPEQRAERAAVVLRQHVVAERLDDARAVWNACNAAQRARVATVLSRLLVGAPEGEARSLAIVLGLGLLRVAARAGHRMRLSPAAEFAPPSACAPGEFVAADDTCNLFVRPGLAWCQIVAVDVRGWWGPHDPRCLQCLLDVPQPSGEVPLRSLAALPTHEMPLPTGAMVQIEAGLHDVVGPKGVSKTLVAAPFAVGVNELTTRELRTLRRLLHAQHARRAELDAWLRHPHEPRADADAIWATWKAAGAGAADGTDGRMPAALGVWEAHRCATWLGCRLPSVAEWQVAAWLASHESAVHLLKPGPPQSVDADPGPDVTARGVRFANSNAREWAFFADEPGQPVNAFPQIVSRGDREDPMYVPPMAVLPAPSEPCGYRLYRTVVSPRDL